MFQRNAAAPRRAERLFKRAQVFLSVLLLATSGAATEYWVNNSSAASSDKNSGTQSSPWLTIQHGAAVAAAGDVIHVQAGAVYDECVAPVHSGCPGTFITIKGEGFPVVRGFNLVNVSYIRIVGFEIFQGSTSYNCAGVCFDRAHNNQILDNYIHQINSLGIRTAYNSYGNNNLVRSNRLDRLGLVPGNTAAAPAILLWGTNNLIEYNDISRSDDPLKLAGFENIARNNFLHDFWPADIFPDPHIDFIQCDNAAFGVVRNMFERNCGVDNLLANSHGGIFQGTQPSDVASLHDFIYRQNVIDQVGSFTLIDQYFAAIKYYNNTVANAGQIVREDPSIIVVCHSTGFLGLNNIFYALNQCVSFDHVYGTDATTAATFRNDYDLTFLSGSIGPPEAHGRFGDPLFVGSATSGFQLQPASPAIGHAGAQTTAVGAGVRSNVIAVRDAGVFCDGWGIVLGDEVSIGQNPPVSITNIDYANNILFLSQDASWSSGDGVMLASTSDIGAYPFRPGGYDYSVTLTSPADGSCVSGPTILDAAVDNPLVVRFVKFYVDGLEVGTVNAQPYTLSVSLDSGQHTLQARAYALYADTKLADCASVTVNVGSPPGEPVQPPAVPVSPVPSPPAPPSPSQRVLDQTFGDDANQVGFADGGLRVYLSSSNSPAASHTLCQLNLRMYQSGSTAADLVAEIRSNNAGVPGAVLATSSNTVHSSDVGPTEQWVAFSFSGVPLAQGTTYWYGIKASGHSAANYYTAIDGDYLSGAIFMSADGTAWSQNCSRAWYCQTYKSD